MPPSLEQQTAICDISFQERARILSHDFLKCCAYIIAPQFNQQLFTKRLYSKLISTTQVLEDFLDFHGAKNNANWYFYRELSSAVRHLSLGGYVAKHIYNRINFYDLSDTLNFKKDSKVTFEFINDGRDHRFYLPLLFTGCELE